MDLQITLDGAPRATKTCKTCKLVDSNLKHIRLYGKMRYVNQSGQKWQGLLCPSCVIKRKNKDVRNYINPDLKMRKCTQCGILSTGYYRCSPCFIKWSAKRTQVLIGEAFLYGIT